MYHSHAHGTSSQNPRDQELVRRTLPLWIGEIFNVQSLVSSFPSRNDFLYFALIHIYFSYRHLVLLNSQIGRNRISPAQFVDEQIGDAQKVNLNAKLSKLFCSPERERERERRN